MPFKFFSTLYHLCWYALAALIILLAIAITIFRALLPGISQYRDDIQIWVSDYMGHPVEFRSINADWHGWIPNLYMNDISVIDNRSGEAMVHFDQASVTLDLLASLRKQELVPHSFSASGLDLSLTRHANGSVSLSEQSDIAGQTRNKETNDALGQWFRSQKRIKLENVSIIWQDEKNLLPPLEFHQASIQLLSDRERMQISGSAATSQHLQKTRLQFALDIHGHLHTTDWSGQVYIEANQLEPAFWSEYFDLTSVTFDNSAGGVKLWSDWQKTKLMQLEGNLEYADVNIHGFSLQNLSTEFSMQRNPNDDWLLSFSVDEFASENGVSPGMQIEVAVPAFKSVDNRKLTAYVNQIGLADIQSLLLRFDSLDNEYAREYQVDGIAKDLTLKLDMDEPTSELWLDSSLNNVSIRKPEKFELTGLSGHLHTTPTRGRIQLNNSGSKLAALGYTMAPVRFNRLRADIDWHITPDQTLINIHELSGRTAEFDFVIQSRLLDPNSDTGSIDLVANLSPVTIEALRQYLPVNGSSELSLWLEKSLLGGRLLNTDIAIRGPIHAFPFKNDEGRFQLITQLENVTLDYDPEWPPIDNLNAEIQVNNQSLEILADSGNVFSSVLSSTVATIPDYLADKPHVLLNGQFDGNFEDCALFIQQSPLNDIRSLQIIKDGELSGQLELALDLDIPLYDRDTAINGTLRLPGNTLNSSDIGVSLENLNGVVHFTRNSIKSDRLRARYFEREIDLAIEKLTDKDSEQAVVTLSGTMDREFLRKQFNHYFPESRVMVNDYIEHFSGASSWQAVLTLNEDESVASDDLFIQSDLVGMRVALPAPLAKQRTAILPVRLNTRLDNDEKQLLDVQIGEVFAARLEYGESRDKRIDALRVNFGGELENLTSTQGITVTGSINDLSLSDWMNLIKKNMRQTNEPRQAGYKQVQVDVDIAQLEFFEQQFSGVALDIDRKPDDWQIKINAAAIDGLISIPAGKNVIVADLNRLQLQKHDQDGEDKDTDFNPANIPSIHAHVNKVSYGESELGELYLVTSRLDDGLSFDEMTFTKQDMSITGYGQWVKHEEQNISRFTFDVSANELNNMLNTFQFTDAAIENGQTSIKLEAEWFGRPVDFSLDTVSGRLDMLIEKGQFLDINPKAGRLFGLLSLQTLPRRLALDFSDIFGKGLSFDKIEGQFTIENGHAYTNDLSMTGPTANIAVTGRTGLIDKDYDQLVTVTPQISDTLPVASALFGPIGVGVGAIIYFASELFESIPKQIDKILQYQYTITGSWKDPQIEEVREKASG